ncbi:MAG: D-tyrosyl-tRNA(Tyr) deacylase [Flavobacteriales bacterium]|nr:D-tyrosyl-tRNA(Tyr) deacylase [Flavobacteriales bacterium]|tara:strand:- start:1000 stop:1437 length:438 start_codon:yes stop_codon:yes gene_type:complete
MRLVIQRVKQASVCVNDKVHSSIGKGLLCLVGFSHIDEENDYQWAINKILNLKLFRKNKSVEDVNGEILIVSQFTLFASIKKGTKPSWSKAAKSAHAKNMYVNFMSLIKKKTHLNIQSGVFGEDMDIKLINSGPLTIIVDTEVRE